MMDFDDDEMFGDLFASGDEFKIEVEFDVTRAIRSIGREERVLAAKKRYKDELNFKLDAGLKKSEANIDFLKTQIKGFMEMNNKNKLSFDDLGTVSLAKKAESLEVVDEEILKTYLESLGNAKNKYLEEKVTLKVNKKEVLKLVQDRLSNKEITPGASLIAEGKTLRITLKK